MRRVGYRYQRTLARPAEVVGTGIVTGKPVRLRLLPADADAGLTFRRTDLPNAAIIPARSSSVSDTRRRTTLGPAAAGVTLVEHELSALAGCRIDNCLVELDAPEPPGLDGSAQGFVRAILEAGAKLQTRRRPIYTVAEPLTVRRDGATIRVEPHAHELRISYILDYGPTAPVPRASVTLSATPEVYVRELAPCRTFVLEAEVAALRAQGVGRHLTARDLLVFGPRGLIDNRLRFADEPARHKILDLVGDLALCGFDLTGHLVAYRSGHALNVELAQRLAERVAAGLPRMAA